MQVLFIIGGWIALIASWFRDDKTESLILSSLALILFCLGITYAKLAQIHEEIKNK